MHRVANWFGHTFLVLAAACSGHKAEAPAPCVDLATPRGGFVLQMFRPAGPPTGLVVFGSGDGGWSYFEDAIAGALAKDGFAVIGWDCPKYVKLGKYDQARLAGDVAAAIGKGREFFRCADVPVILGGWSTGAEQMVSVAASPEKPSGTAGLLLLSPGERGRYGITVTDLLGIMPRGPDTFALADMSGHLGGLRVLQFHAEKDDLDQTAWLEKVTVPKKLEVYPKAGHNFDGAAPAFLERLVHGMGWLIHG